MHVMERGKGELMPRPKEDGCPCAELRTRFMKTRFTGVAIVVVVAALVGGFAIGRFLPRELRHAASPDTKVAQSKSALHDVDPGPGPTRLAELKADFDRALGEPRPTRREDALLEIAMSIGVFEIRHALGYLGTRTEPEADNVVSLFLRRWATIDPRAALAYARDIPGAAARERALRTVFEELTASDPLTAVAHARSLPTGSERNQALNLVLDAVAIHDPQRALDLLRSLPNLTLRTSFETAILRRWAALDPAAAALAVPTCARLPSALYGEIAAQWSVRNRSAALEWASSLPSAQARNLAFERIVGAWATVDIQAAANLTVSLPASQAQGRMVEAVAKQWAADNPAAAMNWAANLPAGSLRNRALDEVVAEWAKTDPASALKGVLALDSEPQKRKALVNIGARWALDHTESATDWALQLSVTDQRTFGNSLLALLGNRDPASIASLVMSLDPAVKSDLVPDLARRWADQDLKAALNWLDTVPAEGPRCAALDGIIGEWARHDPQGAAAYLQQTPPSSDARRNAEYMRTIGSVWASTAPEEAAKWAAAVPEGASRTEALAAVFKSWAANSPVEAVTYATDRTATSDTQPAITATVESWVNWDRDAAAQWVASLPPGSLRDSLVGTVTQDWEPDRAVGWVASLGEGAEPSAALQQNVERWFYFDPWSARAWVQAAPFSEAAKRELVPVPFRSASPAN